MTNNISNPLNAGKTLDFNAFENLAKNKGIDGQATIGVATDSSGRSIIGLSANVGGKKVQQLGNPLADLSKVTPDQRNGILATQAFKQALVQRYGESIANAVDKHLVKSGHAQILTADDLRKNLKVAAAIVKILRQQSATPTSSAHAAAEKASTLLQSRARRQEDGSPLIPSAPPRSRSSSTNSNSSVNQYFANREQPPAYRSTEDLRPTAPPRSRANSEQLTGSGDEFFDHLEPNVSEEVFDHLEPKVNEEVLDSEEQGFDVNGESLRGLKNNPLYIKADIAFEIAGESAHLLDDQGNQVRDQRPRRNQSTTEELDSTLQKFEALKATQNKTTKS